MNNAGEKGREKEVMRIHERVMKQLKIQQAVSTSGGVRSIIAMGQDGLKSSRVC